MTSTGSTRRRIGPKLLLLFGGLLLGLLGAELFLRASGRDPIDHVLHLNDTRREWNSECFRLDPATGYAYVPGVCNNNQLGFPDEEFQPRAPGERRILLLGDSISADRLYADFLENLLAERLGVPVNVLNTGHPGFSTLNEAALYEDRGVDLDHDMVLLQFFYNDFSFTPFLFQHEGQIVKVADKTGQLWGRSRWWFQHSALYRSIVFQVDASAPGQPDPEVGYERNRDALIRLKDRVESEGKSLLVVIFPPLALQDHWSAQDRSAQAWILALLREHSIPFVDLTPDFHRGDVHKLQREHAPEVYANLRPMLPAFSLPETAGTYLLARDENELQITKFKGGSDLIHPNFLGHYIAALRLAERLGSQPQLLGSGAGSP